MFSAESIIRPRGLSCALSLGSAETMPMQGANRPTRREAGVPRTRGRPQKKLL